MDFFDNNNIFELLDYYKKIHKYFLNKKDYIYNVLKGLNNEIIIEKDERENKIEDEYDFSNYYFFYIQNITNNIHRKSGMKIKRTNLDITNAVDFLVGLNFNNLPINSNIRIFLTFGNIRKNILNVTITEQNKNNIFLPINNKDFFPYFLVNRNVKMTVFSDKELTQIDCIYLKLHSNYSNKFLNFPSYLLNSHENTYYEFKDYNIKIKYLNGNIIPNNYMFYFNVDKYYGRKIFNFFKKIKMKNELKRVMEKNGFYKDINNFLSNFI